ncbi:MAG: Trk system potassium transporter TrkA [Magnetococcales bacterium]|nr:Trk system potassium transporter TrkA [Magnetococcales bacterium]
MNIIIVGAGLVGVNLAKHLSNEQHNVTLIDSNHFLVKRVQESLDVQVLEGDATDGHILKSAGLDSADLVLAVSNSDESNLIIALMARAINGSVKIVARVRRQQYLNSPWHGNPMGETVLFSPDQAAVEMIEELLSVDQSFEVVPFEHGAIRVAGFILGEGSALVGKPLKDIRLLAEVRALIVAVDRKGELFIPDGHSILQPLDRIYITLIAETELNKILATIGIKTTKKHKIVIAGGGWKGEQIARSLEKTGIQVFLLDKDLERCNALADQLKNTHVLFADATDPEILQDLLGNTSTFLALTNHQEVNFLLCLQARQYMNAEFSRTIALVDNDAYLSMAHGLGIDAVVSPRLAAVGNILRFLGKGKVIDAAPLLNGRLEAFSLEVQPNSRLAGVCLKDLRLPAGIIVAGGIKNGAVVVPNGNLAFTAGDHLLIISFRGHIKQLDDYLSVESA